MACRVPPRAVHLPSSHLCFFTRTHTRARARTEATFFVRHLELWGPCPGGGAAIVPRLNRPVLHSFCPATGRVSARIEPCSHFAPPRYTREQIAAHRTKQTGIWVRCAHTPLDPIASNIPSNAILTTWLCSLQLRRMPVAGIEPPFEAFTRNEPVLGRCDEKRSNTCICIRLGF